ncbi:MULTISPECIES: NAD(P)/FAD-dependent oxidoreductase [unclassified Moorena]|uniref:FAD-dependent oxidoreductase n=1 Tax=unclassified Moorena TaxID=2683338 RepID=UPI0013FE7E3E|nr:MULTISPECIES: NAD(P)/FAD-dependent oxidoreductase [unclassified Moorena]NEO14572.1 FAD-dependent monooxygenase [Moorena sp. SIO3E8]NEP99822.1 FAD-dependent monooxygenase [Moorena sp. SIO3F7]
MIDTYDIVVVGAGPVGLATAIGLQQRGISNFLVLDQTRDFRRVGQVIDLLPNGLKALKHIAPSAYEAVKKTDLEFFQKVQPNEKWVYKNFKGEQIHSFPLSYEDWFNDYGEGRVSISWYDLQTTLRQQLPVEQVKANHRCINVVDEGNTGYVRLDFVSDAAIEANPYAHWSNRQNDQDTVSFNSEHSGQQFKKKSIRARLVVAADGINSTIRQIVYKDSPYSGLARPDYSGFAALFCMKITDIPPELSTELENKFFQQERIITITNDQISEDSASMESPRMLLFRRPNAQFGYLLHLPLNQEELTEKSGSALIALALRELENANFPKALTQLVALSPPVKIKSRPYYIHRVETLSPWSSGRVILVGDAAHGMPPFMAQGANQGLEDALVVATMIANIVQKNNLDNIQAIANACLNYESLRRPLMEKIQQATLNRIPYSNKQAWHDYQQLVYCRNFDQLLERCNHLAVSSQQSAVSSQQSDKG